MCASSTKQHWTEPGFNTQQGTTPDVPTVSYQRIRQQGQTMLLTLDLLHGCDEFFAAVADAILDLDSDVSDWQAHMLAVDPAMCLGRHLAARYDSLSNQEQRRAFQRFQSALHEAIQTAASAREAKGRGEP